MEIKATLLFFSTKAQFFKTEKNMAGGITDKTLSRLERRRLKKVGTNQRPQNNAVFHFLLPIILPDWRAGKTLKIAAIFCLYCTFEPGRHNGKKW